jgi:hypothetical protein
MIQKRAPDLAIETTTVPTVVFAATEPALSTGTVEVAEEEVLASAQVMMMTIDSTTRFLGMFSVDDGIENVGKYGRL